MALIIKRFAGGQMIGGKIIRGQNDTEGQNDTRHG